MRRLLIPFVVNALVSLVAGRLCLVSSECQCIFDRPWKMNIVCQSHKHFNYFQFSESNITSLEITNASPYSLHESMFINLKLKKLTLSNFKLINMQSEWHDAFVGVKGTLERLEIYNSDFQFPWNFDPYELIAHLTHLTIVRSVFALNYPSKITLNQLKHLQYIAFRDFGEFHDEFNVEDLSDLRLVSLSGNGIYYIKRGMFPTSANKLWHIDLSHNLIQNLPEDIFQHMPKLREVRLDHNKLKVLSKGIFNDMIKRGQLKELWIQDNLLTCDQNICWLEKLGLSSFTLSASCHDPKLREAFRCN